MFIFEAPGKDEEKQGCILVGKTGREVEEHYLPLAGLRRQSSYLTNAIKCLPTSSGGKLDPKRPADLRLLASCANTHLLQEIAELEPSLLIPCGAFACLAIDPRLQLDLHHGIPFETQWGITAFPMFHPALGMHSPKQMLHIRTDWIRLRQYLAGELVVTTDEYPNPDYREVTDAAEIAAVDPTQPMACDTESRPSEGPYFLTYSTRPGMGRLIRAARVDLIARFQAALDRHSADILFHHWLYDAPIVSRMGLRFPARLVRDTMVRAYHLGNLPQALKSLAFRELGMAMQDFEDLVLPHSRPLILDYYRRAHGIKWPRPDPQMVQENGVWKLYKPQSMNTKIKTFFTNYAKAPETKDPVAMWDNWEESHAMLEAELGPWPGVDIAHVPFEESLYYACRDSDATLRLHYVEERMAKAVKLGVPQEKWRDAAA